MSKWLYQVVAFSIVLKFSIFLFYITVVHKLLTTLTWKLNFEKGSKTYKNYFWGYEHILSTFGKKSEVWFQNVMIILSVDVYNKCETIITSHRHLQLCSQTTDHDCSHSLRHSFRLYKSCHRPTSTTTWTPCKQMPSSIVSNWNCNSRLLRIYRNSQIPTMIARTVHSSLRGNLTNISNTMTNTILMRMLLLMKRTYSIT